MKHREIKVRIPQPEFHLSDPKLRRWLPSPGNVVFMLLMIGLLLWAQTAGALPLPVAQESPNTSANTIAYQGRLADASGSPITALVNMEFRLYDSANGPVPLWEEFWTGASAVSVSDGLFNVMLGSLTPIPLNVIAQQSTLWLGITAGTDNEMTPRVQLGSVPFATRAAHVSSLNAADGDPADAVRVDNDGNMLVTSGDSSSVQGAAKLSRDGLRVARDDSSLITMPTGLGISILRNGPAVSIRNDGSGPALLVEKGRVGIGTTNPQAMLHVNGNIKFDGQKMCSVTNSGNWRDSVLVPSSWTRDACNNFRHVTINGGEYQLACIFEDSFSFGSSNGGIPSPNCGW